MKTRIEVDWADDVVTYVRPTRKRPHAAPCQLGEGYREDYVVEVEQALVETYQAAWQAFLEAEAAVLSAARESHLAAFAVHAPRERV